MIGALHHQPTPTELQAHIQHRSFHRKIAEKAAALHPRPEPVVPLVAEETAPAPALPVPFLYNKEPWFHIVEVSSCRLTTHQIKLAVCKHFGLDMNAMVTGRRSKNLVRPRQLAMFLCKELTSLSFPYIGHKFGGSDHTTVLHACRRVPLYCKEPEFRAHHDAIRATLVAML